MTDSMTGVSDTVNVTDVIEGRSFAIGVAGIITSTLFPAEFFSVGRNPTSSFWSLVFVATGSASSVFVTAEPGAIAFFLGDNTFPICL